jgi:hypothetical protein
MTSDEPHSKPDQPTPAPAPAPPPLEAGSDTGHPDPPPAARSRRPARTWCITLGAGLLAGVVSWGVGEATLTTFKPKLEVVHLYGGGTSKESTVKGEAIADTRNATLAFGLLGATLGLVLGIAGGFCGDERGRGVTAGLVGLVVGGGAGVLASLALVPIFHRKLAENFSSVDLTTPMLVHAGVWAAVGAAGGLAYAMGSGLAKDRTARAVIGGLVGGALGAVAYDLIGVMAFPLADTHRPLSLTWPTRLLARLMVTTLAAAGATVLASSEDARRTGSAAPAS